MNLDANMFVERLPARSLRVGMVVLRLELCRRCERDTTHSYELLEESPRVWGMRCLRCSQRLREREA